MDYSNNFIRLGEFASEVYQYQLMSRNMINKPFGLNIAMIGFVFPDLVEAEIKDMIDALQKEQYIIQTNGTTLIFSDTFYKTYGRSTVVIPR